MTGEIHVKLRWLVKFAEKLQWMDKIAGTGRIPVELVEFALTVASATSWRDCIQFITDELGLKILKKQVNLVFQEWIEADLTLKCDFSSIYKI